MQIRLCYNIVGLPRSTFMQVSPTLRFFRKSGTDKNVLKDLKCSVGIEPPLESTELKPELLTTECTIQIQSAIKLSYKVAQSTPIFIDKYRFKTM